MMKVSGVLIPFSFALTLLFISSIDGSSLVRICKFSRLHKFISKSILWTINVKIIFATAGKWFDKHGCPLPGSYLIECNFCICNSTGGLLTFCSRDTCNSNVIGQYKISIRF